MTSAIDTINLDEPLSFTEWSPPYLPRSREIDILNCVIRFHPTISYLCRITDFARAVQLLLLEVTTGADRTVFAF